MTKKIGNHRWGPGGLAAARVFSQSLPNFEIEIFVKDYDIGGVWHYPEQKVMGGSCMTIWKPIYQRS